MKKHFTLIELLVVIAIIGVLAAISIPVGANMINSAKKTKAKVEMQGLQRAFKNYYDEYRNFTALATKPVINANESDITLFRDILSSFSQRKYAGKGKIDRFNPKSIKLWDSSPGNFEDQDFKFTDPWGTYYVIWLDDDDNGYAGPGEDTDEGKKASASGLVHLISAGPDKIFQLDIESGTNKEKNLKSAGCDDVVTWQ